MIVRWCFDQRLHPLHFQLRTILVKSHHFLGSCVFSLLSRRLNNYSRDILKMEGPNGPSVYQQTLSSSNNTHTNSSGILPILEPHQTLSKIHTNGEASVTSDKIYDEIDELKFEIKNQAATGLVVANNKPAKSRRSSLLSKLFKFHRNPPPSSSTPNHCRLFEKLPLENPTALTPERTMEAVNDDGMENSFLELARNNSGPLRPQLRGQLYADPYNWPHDSSLDVATTALVIVDMQKDCKFISSSIVLDLGYTQLSYMICYGTICTYTAFTYTASMVKWRHILRLRYSSFIPKNYLKKSTSLD